MVTTRNVSAGSFPLNGLVLSKLTAPLLWLVILFFAGSSQANAQVDYQWWNDLHGWKPGMPSWKRWIIISPGYLGPNALPVPDPRKGFNPEQSEISFSASRHFHPGDPTQDISGRLYLPYADGRIAFEAYGVIIENYAFSEEIRNERFARVEDGRGITQGDFYFSTLIQIVRNRIFPNTLFRIAGRTASGGGYNAARFSDNPGYFFDFSFSKDLHVNHTTLFRPFASFGFYSWQTNSDATLQNDAPFYAAGMDFKTGGWLFTGNFSGYSGYQLTKDKPQITSLHVRHDWETSAIAVEFLMGLRHWEYQTIRFTYSWKFDAL
ncbi:MAG: hypothetical protein ACOZDD_00270 [Bacteroidota bacterium]